MLRFCNILRSIKTAFLELERAMFIGATPVPMFTIINPDSHTHSKQSKTFHAKCSMKLNCERQMGSITKCDCMSVTYLNQTVGDIRQVVDVCSKLNKYFFDYCLFNMFDQLVVGIVFSCF